MEIFDLSEQKEVGLLSHNGGKENLWGSQVIFMGISFYTLFSLWMDLAIKKSCLKSVISKAPLK